MNKNKDVGTQRGKPLKWDCRTIITAISTAIALLALCISGIGLYNDHYRGELDVIPVKGYAIMRGYHSLPSDHLILTLNFSNEGQKISVLRDIELLMERVERAEGSEDKIGEEIIFHLDGGYDILSLESLEKNYEIVKAIMVEPRTVISKHLVFHIHDWWKNESEKYEFRFKAGEKYKVTISYLLNPEEPPLTKVLFEDFSMWGYVDDLELDRETGVFWDWFDL